MSFKSKPFIITIDTEGDNLWSKPSNITTRNAEYIGRFQKLCAKYGFKPTYLTNYEMAINEDFCEIAKSGINNKMCEVGMHLHAWNSPPYYRLTTDDNKNQPYLIEYPKEIMEEKIVFMTQLLEKQFGIEIYSHRAGRWAMDERYMQILENYGYLVDCSVTPGVSWKNHFGDPIGQGGIDYTNFPLEPYHPHINAIGIKGSMNILEIPVSIVKNNLPINDIINCLPGAHRMTSILQRVLSRLTVYGTFWLRPNGRNNRQMKYVIDQIIKENISYAEFMLHSSELMPGGSPVFKSEKSIEKLYQSLEKLFEYLQRKNFIGMTLKEYRDEYVDSIN